MKNIDNQRDFLIKEYEQIGMNIRMGWQYIFDFFRYFVFIQLVLFGVLAGYVSYGDSIKVSSQKVLSTATKSVNTATNQNSNVMEKTPSTKYHSLIFYVTCAIGFIFSLSGSIQAHKLFTITSEFVARANAIEISFWGNVDNIENGCLESSTGSTLTPHYTFMNLRRIKISKSVMNTKYLLVSVYASFCILWLSISLTLPCK